MNRLIPIAVIIVALGIGAYFLFPGQQDVQSTEATTSTQGSIEVPEGIDLSTVTEMTLGNPDAPVTVIEYASFTCPHCATFHANQFKKLKADYIDTGKINFIYREVYFDQVVSLWASAIARCAGPERFFGMTDLIYKGQEEWIASRDPQVILTELRKIGRLAGLSEEQLAGCLNDGTRLQTLSVWEAMNIAEHGITSTPSIVINGTTYRNMSYEDLRELIEAELNG